MQQPTPNSRCRADFLLYPPGHIRASARREPAAHLLPERAPRLPSDSLADHFHKVGMHTEVPRWPTRARCRRCRCQPTPRRHLYAAPRRPCLLGACRQLDVCSYALRLQGMFGPERAPLPAGRRAPRRDRHTRCLSGDLGRRRRRPNEPGRAIRGDAGIQATQGSRHPGFSRPGSRPAPTR